MGGADVLTAARSLAERARGLRATSRAEAVVGLRLRSVKLASILRPAGG
jgi:hypothetical protein